MMFSLLRAESQKAAVRSGQTQFAQVPRWLLSLAFWLAPFQGWGADPFIKVTSGAIVNSGGNSLTAAWADVDSDGDLDLFVANYEGQKNFLYLNQGNGSFTAVTSGHPVDTVGVWIGCAWADVDNDGDPDLVVVRYQAEDHLYLNNGGVFTLVPDALADSAAGHSHAPAWADYDRDGWLDLVVARGGGNSDQNAALYRNTGAGILQTVTEGAVVSSGGYSTGAAWADYDHNGFPDLVIGNIWSSPLQVFRNDGPAGFVRVLDQPPALASGDFNGLAWGDYDNDGYLDLFAVQGGVDRPNLLFRGDGHGGFIEVTDLAPSTDARVQSVGAAWADYDNDGDLDLFVASHGALNYLYRNNGDGTFTKVTDSVVATDVGNSTGCAWGDYDGDGFLDLFVANWEGGNNFLYRNAGNGNSWLRVRCQGVRSNRDGIGAKVWVEAALNGTPVWQYREVTGGGTFGSQELLAHFGLLDATRVSQLRIEWPSGNVQEFTDLAVNQVFLALEEDNSVLRIEPNGGLFTDNVTVTLTKTVLAGEIRYTLDGSEPLLSAERYTQPFVITSALTVKARVYINGFPASEVVSAEFTPRTTPDIEFIPVSGLFTNEVQVSMVNNLDVGVIRYSLTGTPPTSGSPAYQTPVLLTATTEIQAQVFFNSFPVSDVLSATYSRVYAFEDDGIPFDWREQYFGAGFLTDPAAARDADPDGDGFTNYEEYQAGTHPADGESLPQIVVNVRAIPKLIFTTVPGRVYQVRRADSLTDPVWHVLEPALPATSTHTVFIDPDPPSPAYYDVVLVP
jgi:enediyne biosynthesis protein E4